MANYPLPPGQDIIAEDVLLDPSFHIHFSESEQDLPESSAASSAGSSGQFDMKVTSNDRITATDHFQDVRHLVLETDSDELR